MCIAASSHRRPDTKPRRKSRALAKTDAHHQVDETPSSNSPDNPSLKRLTVNIPDELHHRIKVRCAHERQQISDVVRSLLTKEFPPA